MFPLLLLIILLLVLTLLPLQLETVFMYDGAAAFRITPLFCGLKKDFHFRLVTIQGRHEIQYVSAQGILRQVSPGKLTNPTGKHLIQRLWKAKRIRRFLLKRIKHFRLQTDAVIHACDAAATAALTGCIHVISSAVHAISGNVITRVIPGFSAQRTSIVIRCIFSMRLGTILITSVLMMLHGVQQQVQRKWR